ncbi:MAG: RNA polymerase sigma factor [Bacteroidota bacterium]
MKVKEHEQIFERWLKKHKGLLFKVVRSYAFDSGDRDDLFQEIAIQLWRSIPKFRNESAETTWIYRVALNTAITWIRKEKKNDLGKEDISDIAHILVSENHEIDERLEWIYRQINRFNEIDRSILLLMLDGFSYKEISNMLGIGESNVGVKINRLKKYLIKESEKREHYGVG